jgi:diaminopimelate decarboxylase
VLDRATLQRVVELGVPVNAGSPQMLEQLGMLSRGHQVWLRVNPGFGHGHNKKTNTGGEHSKHGIWHATLRESLALVQRYGLELRGFHMHIGSGVDYRHLENVCDAMVSTEPSAAFALRLSAAQTRGSSGLRPSDADPSTGQHRGRARWSARSTS